MPMLSSRSKLSSSSLSVLGGLIIATFVFVVLTTTTIVTTAKAQTGEFNVYKFDNNGNFILGWGSTGSGPGQFYHAHGIAIDSSGNVYVSDQGNFQSEVSHPDAIPHISKFTADGKFITKWGSQGTGDGQFTRLEDIAVDRSGDVYVAELGNGRISKFTADGKFITKWSSTTNNNTNPATSAAAAATTTTTNNNTLIMPWG